VALVAAGCAYPDFAFTQEDVGSPPDTSVAIDSTVVVDSESDSDATSLDTEEVRPEVAVDSRVDVAPDTKIIDSGVDVADTRDAAGTLVTLLARGGVWRYLDDGTSPSSTWRGGGGFADSTWKLGAAQLGFGDGDEKTVIASGAPDAGDSGLSYATYYFRRFITVTDAASFDTVTIRLLRDDGAVVYFNGSEVVRSNMPGGTVTSSTFASAAVSAAEEDTFYTYVVPAATLAEGANVIAVEVHQSSLGSSDVSFDLELIGHKP
jgi:hypothetical protein